MKKRSLVLSLSLAAISTLTLILAVHLIATKTSLQPQLFFSTCGEILKDIQKHVHINLAGVAPLTILLTALVGIVLAFIQILRFTLSHKQLIKKHQDTNMLSQKLNRVMQKHNLQHIPFVVSSENKLTAYTTGLIRPTIVISSSLISKLSFSQLEAVVLHELYHVKKRHIFWLLFARVVSSLLFFVPLTGYLAQQLKVEFELAADSYVVRKQKTSEHICGCLAFNLQYANAGMPQVATSPIEKRIESLVTKKVSLERIRFWQLLISILSVGIMTWLSFNQPAQISASIATKPREACSVEEDCQTTDCFSHKEAEQLISP